MIGRRTLCFLTFQNGNKNFSPSAELLGQTRKQSSLNNNNYPPNGIVRSEFPPVPLQTIPIHESLQDFIWRHSIEQPGRPAFISAECPDDRLTFGEFLLQCHSVAAFLHKIGFSKGDVAGVVVPNCWQFLAAFMGAAMQGGCITGANAMLTELELARQFDEPKCRVAFCADFMLDKMLEVQKNCQNMKYLVLIPSQFPVTPFANLPPNVLNWTEIVETRPNFAKLLTPLQFDIDRDLAYLPFSSGTTGPGKGVMLTHKNVGTMLNIFNRHFDERVVCRMDPNWKWRNEHSLIILPLYHIYGFILGLNSLRSGGTGIMLKKFDLKLFCKTIQDYKIKYATLVPPLLVALAKNAAAIQRYDLSSLRFVMTGAAPAGEDICDELKRAIPSVEQIAQGYGMTEQSLASHLPVFGMENQKAAGRLNANFEMKIVDVERRTPMPFGEVGEICTRSPTTMLGYLDRPDATAETVDEEGWLKTGDIGYQDEKGWTYVVDRLKELIKVKGLQVAPAELEDHLLSHPDIKDCAVIGVADEKCGEVPKAFVVKASKKLNENEVKEFIKGKVAPFKQLKFVEFIDEIPKSPSGKILRRILRNTQNNDVQQK